MKKLLFGVAYYDEYMPYDRLALDIKMMKDAGINVVRIAESTWSTLEPQNNVFDFYHIDRVLDAMHEADIHVIIGTPTYAVPTWMVKEHPEVLAITIHGPNKYGPRQNMDITNPTFLFYAERIIRNLMDHVKDHPAVIGYQADNETKHYHTAGPNVQQQFVKYIKKNFDSLNELNTAYGLDYWSNRINAWEDFPSVIGTINPSLSGAFSQFQRAIVSDYLGWQAEIIREYRRENQFITHNFDFEWRGHSYGVQPDVDHFDAAKPFDIVGVDIYHPSQEELTGCEIAFCGDIARSLKQNNYFVLETEAQGFASWVPFPNQLRLQAFSHIASGAIMVAYWHWHSIHNSAETYWKGLLSHDFKSNPTYEEAKSIGKDFERLSDDLIGLKKENKVAILINNSSLTAINDYKRFGQNVDYNDQVRRLYDALYKMNVECDFICDTSSNRNSETSSDTSSDMNKYDLILVPSLYTASDRVLNDLNAYVEQGGNIVYTLRSGFSDEHVKVRTIDQPGIISKACGVFYNQFIESKGISLTHTSFEVEESNNKLSGWMELLIPNEGTEVLSYYNHTVWGKYAAITQNKYGLGRATYIGCSPSEQVVTKVLEKILKEANIGDFTQEIRFPLIKRTAINANGKKVYFYFNYSSDPINFELCNDSFMDVLADRMINAHETITLSPWDFRIMIEA